MKKTGKYYLKFITICLAIMVFIAFVLPGIIYYGYEFFHHTKDKPVEEVQVSARENARNQGILLDETPEELLARAGVIYHDGDSLEGYYATEPIKVRSGEEEFEQYCIDYFGTESGVTFYAWEGECFRAVYGNYEILRTELFNPEENGSGIGVSYVEDVGMEGMTNSTPFYYDATGKYALVKYGDNAYAIAKFLGLTIDGKDDDYNPFVNQRYEQERERLEAVRNIGVILESAPDELTRRTEDTFDGTEESIYNYFGASEAIKVSSGSDEFEKFCREFFFDHPEPVTFYRSANETTWAICGEYEIYRTEFFNPEMESGQLYYEIDGLEDGMSLITDFVYDSTGKYAMIWYDWNDSSKYVLAKFIGLNFSEENPYVSPIQDELDKLSLQGYGDFEGDIWEYVAYDSVIRVESDEEEFVQYCDEFFGACEENISYEQNRDGAISIARCGDYIMLRTQFFDPIRYGERLFYEGDSVGDTEPVRSEFFYDSTGKYALVYIGNNSQNDSQNELCIKFLGF